MENSLCPGKSCLLVAATSRLVWCSSPKVDVHFTTHPLINVNIVTVHELNCEANINTAAI